MIVARLLVALLPLSCQAATVSMPVSIRLPGLRPPTPAVARVFISGVRPRVRLESSGEEAPPPGGPAPLLDSTPEEWTDDERAGEGLAGFASCLRVLGLSTAPSCLRAASLAAPGGLSCAPSGCLVLRC
jgi:hypothetical protein